MTVIPVPFVEFIGQRLSPSLHGSTSAVLDGLSITWGKTNFTNNAESSTASFSILDTTGGDWVRINDPVGEAITVGWEYEDTTEILIRGNIDSSKAYPMGSEENSSWRVDITVTDQLARLSQCAVAPNSPTWPAEYADSRASRILAWCDPNLVKSIGVDKTQWVAPLDPNGQAADGLIAQLYASTQERIVYDPNTLSIINSGRHYYDLEPVVLWRDGLWGNSSRVVDGNDHHPSIDGTKLTYDPSGLSRDIQNSITQVGVEIYWHYEYPDEYDQMERWYRNDQEVAKFGYRNMEVNGDLSAPTYASMDEVDQRGWRYLDEQLNEGRKWRIPPLTRDMGLFGGFESLDEAMIYLRAHETRDTYYISGNRLQDAMRTREFHFVMGGTINFSGGHWVSTIQLGPVGFVTDREYQDPCATWTNIDAGDFLTFENGTESGFHSSVTWRDLGQITEGLPA